MEGVSTAAAAGQLTQQLFGIISAARTAIKDFKSAAEDHKTLSNEFSTILKSIEYTGNVLQRAAGRLTDGELKNALNGENIDGLLGGVRKSIVDAQNILNKHQALRVMDKVRFVKDKGHIREAQVRLSNAGIHLSMFLISLLVDGVVGGTSQAPLAEVLTIADVKASLNEALESVKEEIKLDIQGKGKDSDGATRTNLEHAQDGATKNVFANFKKHTSNISLRLSKSTQKHPDSEIGTESRPQTALGDPAPVSVPDASSAKRSSKNQNARQDDSLNNDSQTESQSGILGETPMSSMLVSDESRPSPPVQSSEAGLETPAQGISSGSAPQHAASTKDGTTQTSPVLAPFTEKQNDDGTSTFDIDTEELLGWDKSPDTSSSSEAGGGTRYSSSESSQESSRFESSWMNLALDRTHGHIFSGREFLHMLEEANPREDGQGSSDTARHVEQALFADATWISALVIGGCCDNRAEKDDDDDEGNKDDYGYDKSGGDRERYGVLVFQRPDNWLQLAKIPRDNQRPASMLCPIVEAMENTPISSRLICRGDHCHILKLYFFVHQGDDGPHLSICTITLAPTLISAAWDVQKLQLSCGDYLPPPMPAMGFFEDPFRERLSYASSSGLLISLYETHDGEWKTYSYTEKVCVRPGDQVFHTVDYDEPSLYLWTYRQDDSMVTKYFGYDHFTLLDPLDKSVTTTKRMNWHGLTLDQSSIPCLPILDDDRFGVGLICKTLEDDIYIFKGDPWHDRHDEPIHLCKVKSGTNISFSQDLRDLFFISTKNEPNRIRIQVSGSEITFTQPSPLFPRGGSSTRLDAISFPGFIFGPKLTELEDEESPTFSASCSRSSTSHSFLSLLSEGARSTASHRTDCEG